LRAEYSIFGFTVGDEMKDAASALEKHGYKLTDSSDDPRTRKIYLKDKSVYIELQPNTLYENKEGAIYSIRVRVITTNKQNVSF
jgi:hypothetical protein